MTLVRRFPIYTLVSIVTLLGAGAFGLGPQAAAGSSSVASGQIAPMHLTDDALCAPSPTADHDPTEQLPGVPAADVALPAGGSCDGVGSGPFSSSVSGSAIGRLSAPADLPPPLSVRLAIALDPPFVRSQMPSEVFEPPRSAR